MYKELLLELSQGNDWAKPQPPCPEALLEKAEKVVGYPFPPELRALLRETNGDKWCLMSAEAIIRNVELNRENWLPLFEEDYSHEEYLDKVDRFIFFAENGCGDYYCYRVDKDGVADETSIYIWEHEYLGEKCWKKVAGSMSEFLTRYYHSEI